MSITKEEALAELARRQKQGMSPTELRKTAGTEISGLDYAKGLGRSLVEGQTLGFADEIGLGMAALPASLMTGDKYGDVYNSMRQTYNKEQAEFERQNPKAALGANIAGGLLTGGAGASKVMATNIARANPIKAASLLSGGTGAVAGAGFAPEMKDVPTYSTTGLAVGAVLPPALALTGKAVSPIASGIKNAFTLESPRTTAAKTLGNFASKDGIPASELLSKMQAMGRNATLSDVAGENLKGASRAVGNLQGQGKDSAIKLFQTRQSGSTKRLMGSLKKLSGGDTKYFDNMQNVINRRSSEAKPLYDAAKSQVISGDDANILMKEIQEIGEGYHPARPFINKFLSKNSDGRKMPKMAMKDLDSLQKELRSKASVAYNKGDGELGGALKTMRERLLEKMDKIPEYGQARKIWSDESSLIDSMKLGKRVLSDDFEEMAFKVGQMSQAEKEGFIGGALKTVRDKLMTGRENKNAATKLATQTVRERLRTVFPDDDSYKTFMNQLDIEDDFAQTYQQVYGGSQTQMRQVGERELIDAANNNAMIAGQDSASMLVNAVQKVTGKDKISQPVIDELQRIMFTPLNQLSKKDWTILRKHNISRTKAKEIQGLIPSIGGGVTVEAGAAKISK